MRVLVAGGGVAGAATALALGQAGIESAVYEAHPSGGADAGAFLTVMANGMAALDRIGATGAAFAAYDAQRRAQTEETVAASARLGTPRTDPH